MDRLLKEWKQIRSSTLAHNAGWMAGGQVLSVGCQGVYFVLLARLLGSTEYGIYAGVVAMVAMLSVYSPLGSAFTLMQYVSPDHEKFALYWGNVLVTTLTFGSLFVVVLVWAVPHLAHSYSSRLVLYASVADCLCAQVTLGSSYVFLAFEKLRTTAFLNLIGNLLRAILAAIMLWRFHHATAQQWAFAALIVSFTVVCTALLVVTRQYGRPAFSLHLLRERSSEGLVFSLSSASGGISNNVDKAMLGHYGMNKADGIYTMAYRVVDVCTMPIWSIHTAAFPRFFRKGIDGVQNTIPYALKLLKRTAPLGLLMAAAMFLAAPLIPYLAGPSFRESVSALRWLCLLPSFRSFQLSAGDAMTGAGYQRYRFLILITAAVFNFGSNLYLIPHFGWHGAAWSSLVTDGMIGLLNWAMLMVLHKRDLNRRNYLTFGLDKMESQSS